MSAPMASVCSPAETRQFPAPSALAGGKVKALESAAAQQSCHFSPGAEAPAIDERVFEFSCVGMVHLHLQRKEKILLAAGVRCPVSSSTSDAKAHRSDLKRIHFHIRHKVLHLQIQEIIEKMKKKKKKNQSTTN